MKQKIEDKVKEIISNQFDISMPKISLFDKLEDELGLDSLDMVELIVEIEKEYDLVIDAKDFVHFITVKQLCDYIHNLVDVKKELVLQQDDAAPDSEIYFKKKFKEMFEEEFTDFLKAAEQESQDNGFTFLWKKDNLIVEISADDQYYKVFKVLCS